jgi:hypothetical protein
MDSCTTVSAFQLVALVLSFLLAVIWVNGCAHGAF